MSNEPEDIVLHYLQMIEQKIDRLLERLEYHEQQRATADKQL